MELKGGPDILLKAKKVHAAVLMSAGLWTSSLPSSLRGSCKSFACDNACRLLQIARQKRLAAQQARIQKQLQEKVDRDRAEEQKREAQHDHRAVHRERIEAWKSGKKVHLPSSKPGSCLLSTMASEACAQDVDWQSLAISVSGRFSAMCRGSMRYKKELFCSCFCQARSYPAPARLWWEKCLSQISLSKEALRLCLDVGQHTCPTQHASHSPVGKQRLVGPGND